MYYGQFELDKIIHQTFFKDKRNGFFVECGAFDGLTESTCKFFEESMGWTGLNIEPTPYGFERLIKNRPNCINLNCALSSLHKKATFTNAIHPTMGRHFGNGSLNHTKEHKTELLNSGCTFETFDIECFKFSELHKEYNLSEIDLFVLDVEGHEVDALSGILNINESFLPKVFCIETSISGFDIISKMLEKNYKFHSNSNHNSFFVKK